MTEKTLRDKRMERVSGIYYLEEDVKEAIKRLKEEFSMQQENMPLVRWHEKDIKIIMPLVRWHKKILK